MEKRRRCRVRRRIFKIAVALVLLLQLNLFLKIEYFYGCAEGDFEDNGILSRRRSSSIIEHFSKPQKWRSSRSTYSIPCETLTHFSPGPQLASKKVFLAGPWVPSEILEHNSQQDPRLEFHVFNNTSMAKSVKLIDEELVSKVGLQGAWEAWKALRPWAFRVDLWRYMILWSEGGIYIDSKIKFMAPVRSWAGLSENQELSICHDMNNVFQSKDSTGVPIPGLWNAAMSARKGSPVLLEAIRQSIENIQNRSYTLESYDLAGRDDLSITGPILLGHVATTGNFPNGVVRIPCGFYGKSAYRNPYTPSKYKTGLIFEIDRREHQRVHSSGNNYGYLWKQKLVYCDEKPNKNSTNSQKLDAPCNLEALLNETITK